MSRMGIGYREMRQYRKLPEDQKLALVEAAKAGDKESFVDLAEEIIARHAKATTGADLPMESQTNIDLSIYLHSLANGETIKVDLSSPGAKAAYERGVALADLKIGQFNFSCNDCHQKSANKWARGQWLGEPRGQYDHFPLWRTSRNETWDIRRRFQWCNVQVRANELPPDAVEYGELELYLRKANEGLTLTAPNIRH